jgi:Ni/Fe-hydrogenase 1 B-type cytochrome subunit
MQASQPMEQRNVLPQGGAGSEHLARKAADTASRQNVYVWELPVRITHWVTVICIGILSVTGIYIAFPFTGTTGDATNQYLMGDIRFIHFVTAFVFTASVLFRLYWMFLGNRWANWRQFLPTKAARRRGIRRMLAFYLFLRRKAPAVIGHNPLAGLAYSVVFLLFLIQILSGFALYSLPFAGGFWSAAFGWINLLLGVQPVRLIHDIIMWLILAFMVHHVYTAILIDIEERSGLVSSIITGWKSFTRHQLEAAEAEDTPDQRGKPFWARLSRKAGQDHA